MAEEILTNKSRTITFEEPDCLLFNPVAEKAWLREKFANIPHFLFRISTPHSDGTTDNTWVKSKDARYRRSSRNRDLFEIRDEVQAAGLLNRHLRWTKKGDPDNFVSWTSSLLFALRYAFYRHKSEKDGSALSEIFVCIVDTAFLPMGHS